MKKVIILAVLMLIISSGLFIVSYPQTANASACSVTSAKFNPSGEQENGWYNTGKNKVSIQINTENCIGQIMTLNLTEADTCGFKDCDDYLSDSGLANLKIKIEQIVTNVDMIAGEEHCEPFWGNDCDLYIEILIGNNKYSSWKKPMGNLMYECDGKCSDNGKLEKITFSGGVGVVDENGDPISVSPTGNKVWDEDYNLLAPLPDISKIDSNTNTFGGYLNMIFKFAIGICGALAVLMMVIYGIQYMGNESVFGHTEAKSKITAAIMGLLLALGAYAILNTINPDLVGTNGINIKQVSLTVSEGQQFRLSETQTTATKFVKTKYYNDIKIISQKQNLPHCIAQVAIQRESNGKAESIGHDEEAPSYGVTSRKQFIESGKTYKNITFPVNMSNITNREFHNDDHNGKNIYSASDLTKKDLGLDWRYSHGIGLMQITFYPKGSNYGDYTKGLNSKITETNVSVKDMLVPQKAIQFGVEMLASDYKLCGSVEGTFRAYGSGNCKANNAFINKEAPLRKNLYDQCVAQDK